ncbi:MULTISPECIES: hypothetical protein [Methanosarcina]|uniref:hypothetical protein n=1 Tax=Methanosarcina TaxID=2207 RepID=UPI000A50FDB8|nr:MULTISPECIES: hypothetical protein [Methanosarcina]
MNSARSDIWIVANPMEGSIRVYSMTCVHCQKWIASAIQNSIAGAIFIIVK